MTIGAFKNVLDDDRISEIIIVDDCSDHAFYNPLQRAVQGMDKVKLFRNDQNVGMSQNKSHAIFRSSNPWCIVFDSDNTIDKSYIDALYKHQWDDHVIYAPSFAKPQFDYRKFISLKFDRRNVKHHIDKRMFDCLMNTCNYFVNRDAYLKVYEHNPEMKGTDTIWFNYLWLKAGYSFYVVPGMQYEHRVHDGSGFMVDCDYNLKKADELKKMIKAL